MAVAVIIAVTAGVLRLRGNEGIYRSIRVESLEGTATVDREDTGEIGVYENMYLESGDAVRVAESSTLCLKLDEDKYILAEAGTAFVLVAEGTRQHSRTGIDLKEGAITNEIQNRLSQKSSYEVQAPNAIMAVRGTCFRVEVTKKADGSWHTGLDTFDGIVSSRLKDPDGTVTEEEVNVNAGQHLDVGNDEEESFYPTGPGRIDYRDQSTEVLEYLNRTILSGHEMEGISVEELKRILDEKERGEGEKGRLPASGQDAATTDPLLSAQKLPTTKDLPDLTNPQELSKLPAAQERLDPAKALELLKPSIEPATQKPSGDGQGAGRPGDTGHTGSAENQGNSGSTGDSGSTGNQGNQGNSENTGSSGTPGDTGKPGRPDTPGDTGNPGGPDTPGDTGNPGGPDTPGDTGNQGGPDTPGDTGNPGGPDTPGDTGNPGGPDTPGDTVYRVTFMYQGTVFGIQEAVEGTLAEEPSLAPSDSGSWEYDFSSPVTEDIEILWK